MKRAFIGGFISFIGSIWALAIVILTANNLVSGWSTPPGRFLTTLSELDMTFIFVLSVLFVAFGILIMAVEFFKKDK